MTLSRHSCLQKVKIAETNIFVNENEQQVINGNLNKMRNI